MILFPHMPCQSYTCRVDCSCEPVAVIGDPVHDAKLTGFPGNGSFMGFRCFFSLHSGVDLVVAKIYPPALQMLKLLSGPGSILPSLAATSPSCLALYSSSQSGFSLVMNILWRISSLFSRTTPKLWYIRRMFFARVEIQVEGVVNSGGESLDAGFFLF